MPVQKKLFHAQEIETQGGTSKEVPIFLLRGWWNG